MPADVFTQIKIMKFEGRLVFFGGGGVTVKATSATLIFVECVTFHQTNLFYVYYL